MNVDNTAAILAALAELRAEILVRLDALTPALDHADREHLRIILPLIGARLGSQVFSIASLIKEVERTDDDALARALDNVGTSKALGKLFARAARHSVEGWQVERRSEPDAQPRLWSVTKNLSQVK